MCLQSLESWTKPGSRRSPVGVLLKWMLRSEPGSHRSPDGILLELILLRTSTVNILYPTSSIVVVSSIYQKMLFPLCGKLRLAVSHSTGEKPIELLERELCHAFDIDPQNPLVGKEWINCLWYFKINRMAFYHLLAKLVYILLSIA